MALDVKRLLVSHDEPGDKIPAIHSTVWCRLQDPLAVYCQACKGFYLTAPEGATIVDEAAVAKLRPYVIASLEAAQHEPIVWCRSCDHMRCEHSNPACQRCVDLVEEGNPNLKAVETCKEC